MGSRVIGGSEQGAAAWDPLDPANVSPLVAFLASEAAVPITGQVFGVVGGQVQLYEGWHPGPEVRVEGRALTVEELSARWPELFEQRSPAFQSPLEDLRVDLRKMLEASGLPA
jgi:hypothetical protein